MSKPRNIPIDITRSASKEVTFAFSDAPDLMSAHIYMNIRRHAVDADTVLYKTIDTVKSTKLNLGECVFSFEPSETSSLTARTYTYELFVILNDVTYVPIIGDWNLYF